MTPNSWNLRQLVGPNRVRLTRLPGGQKGPRDDVRQMLASSGRIFAPHSVPWKDAFGANS